MYSWIVKEKDLKLVDFISSRLSVSKNKAKEIVDSRLVYVNNQRIWIAKHILNTGDCVEFYGDIEKKEEINLDIIYEDEYIIVVNKSSEIITNEAKNSLEFKLREFKNDKNIRAIHRLDRETSGLVIFAKNGKVFETFKNLWRKKEVKKTYLAICYGTAIFKQKWINIPLDNKTATSYVKLLSSKKGFSYFEVEILTGRKHQVRKHLASMGHPIVGDKIYSLNQSEFRVIKSTKRQLLHSYKIEFISPFSSEKISFFAPVPSDFKYFLNKYLNS